MAHKVSAERVFGAVLCVDRWTEDRVRAKMATLPEPTIESILRCEDIDLEDRMWVAARLAPKHVMAVVVEDAIERGMGRILKTSLIEKWPEIKAWIENWLNGSRTLFGGSYFCAHWVIAESIRAVERLHFIFTEGAHPNYGAWACHDMVTNALWSESGRVSWEEHNERQQAEVQLQCDCLLKALEDN